jgi:branched-chain amino acid transport system ATP-binding protein
VDGVSFSVGPGEIVGVIGPNGSGKTTLFNSILGQIRPTSGRVEFCGEDITGLAPLELSRRGVGRTFQTLQVFGQLPVRDNLIVAAQEFKGSLPSRLLASPDAGLGQRADQMIELFRLQHVAHLPAGRLSYGQQKLLEFVRALMTDPEVILLDEPAAGVNRTLLQQLLEHIHRLQEDGKTILIVEHDMGVIMNHCERIFVMDHGVKIAEGSPADIQSDERVIEAYFGRRSGVIHAR